MNIVTRAQLRAVEEARRARHAQRTPFPSRAPGNPTAEILRRELEREKQR